MYVDDLKNCIPIKSIVDAFKIQANLHKCRVGKLKEK